MSCVQYGYIVYQPEMLDDSNGNGYDNEWKRMINEWSIVPVFCFFHLSN